MQKPVAANFFLWRLPEDGFFVNGSNERGDAVLEVVVVSVSRHNLIGVLEGLGAFFGHLILL